MAFNNILVAGAARNCGKSIIPDILRIQKTLKNSNSVKYLIIESDSDDDTLEKLEYLKDKVEDFHYITLGILKNKIPNRTGRLAYCRNKYLEELENNRMFRDTEFVLVADLDGTTGLLTEENLESCWEIRDWDVVAANQDGLYFDLWAFRHPLLSPNDCWEAYYFMVNELGVRPKTAKQKALKSRMFRFDKSLKPFEVDSAFGGLAIYRRHALNGARYEGIDVNGYSVCEHVALHRQIKEKGCRIYINPRMINCYPPTQYVKSRFKKFLLGLSRITYSFIPCRK